MTESNFQNILIVRTDRIGDVVLTTPAIKALRDHLPEAKISILVSPMTKDLIIGNPYLNEVLVDDRKDEHRGLLGFIKLIRLLRMKKFDCAIIYHTKKRTNLACFCAGIPKRIGYKNNKFGFFLTEPIEDIRHKGEKHESQYCLDVLSHLGVQSKNIELYVHLKKESEQWAEKWLSSNKISKSDQMILIHPGASDPSKRWPVKRFVELTGILLKEYNAKCVLVGTADIKNIAQEILSKYEKNDIDFQGRIFDLTGQTTISQLASLMKWSALVVSNDSGPVHVAAGLGTPIISIFTRNLPGINVERWRPMGEKSRIVSVPPDQSLSFEKAGVVDPKYLELITTQEVLEEVDAIFKLC